MDIARKDARPCISMSCTAVYLIEKVEGNLYKVTKQAQHNN